MKYVDGYVLPVPKKNMGIYRRMAQKAARIWRKHGALEYYECSGDDLKPGMGLPFPRLMKLKKTDTPVFAFIVFKSRKHRDQVNAKVMKDPQLSDGMDEKKMPFDCHKMAYGGFKVMVEA